MNTRKIAILLAVLLFIGTLPVVNLAAEIEKEKSAYIVETKFNDSQYLALRDEGRYVEAIDVSNPYLEEKEKILKDLGIKIKGRLHILFVGFQVELDADELKQVESLDFVKKVIPDVVFEVEKPIDNSFSYMKSDSSGRKLNSKYDNSISLMSTKRSGRNSNDEISPSMISSPELIGADEDLRRVYSGKGRLLAVADNDMYPGHEAFNQSLSNPKLTFDSFMRILPNLTYQNQNVTRDAYYSEKIPYAWNFATDNNVLNTSDVISGHGQHIAGIMVGKPMNVNGRMWRGIAPDAQLAMMGLSGGTMTSAIEHATILGADAINISLGTAKGKREDFSYAIYAMLEQAYTGGINVVFAAGNEGDYKGDISILTPDYGNIDDPAFINNIISVGSIENKTITGYTVQVNGIDYSVSPSNIGGLFPTGNNEYVFAGYGRPEDFENIEVNGKIALIKRGENFFNDKIENAEKNGAIGAIVYNNVAGEMGMSLDAKRVHIPSVAMSLEDGEVLKSATNKIFNFTGKPTIMQNPKYGEISSFTTYGLTAYGDLKPDIVAPGGAIYSTQNTKDTFTNMSGTSQAAPHVTASIALLREYMAEDSKFKNVGHEEMASVVKTLLMNSAVPHMDPVTKVASSPRRQGAGVLDIKKAMGVEYTVVNAATNIPSAFINNVENTIHFNLKFKNYSNEEKNIVPSIATTIEAKDGTIIRRRPEELFAKSLAEQKFTLGAYEEKVVSLNVELENLDKLQDFKNGAFIDGYLTFVDDKSNIISFPFASFKGDFERLSMVEKPLYEFDFNTEHPMYWNYNFEDNPWHKFSTHIETNINDKDVIAGVKNFEDIKLEGKKRTNPVFEDIVLSPNNDGYYDKMKLHVVSVRSGSGLYNIKNESNQIVLSSEYERHMFQNFSDGPDFSGERQIGYTAFKESEIEKLDDGLYTLEIGGAPIRDEGKKVENIFKDFIKFRIDTIVPQFKFVSYDEESRKYVFEIKDASEIKETYFELEGKKYLLNDNEFIVPDNAKLEDITISALDAGHNLGKVNANVLKNVDDYGTVNINIDSPKHDMPLNLKYSLKDENGGEFNTGELIPNGKYKLKVESYYPLYNLEGAEEYDILLDNETKEVNIDLKFSLKENTEYKLFVMPSFVSPSESEKFIVKAVSKSNGDVYTFDGKTGNYICFLPFGEYKLSYEFKDKSDENKYIVSFTNEEISVAKQNPYNWINIDEKFDVKINYVLNAEEPIKEQIKFKITNRYIGEVSPSDLQIDTKYTITPIDIPEGYYSVPESIEIEFNNEKLTCDAEFTILKKGEKNYNLEIKDNIESAKYIIYTENDFNGSKENPIKVNDKNVRLEAGKYYITGEPTDKMYFAGVDKENPKQFASVIILKDTVLDLNWIEYGQRKYYKMFTVRSNESDIEDFTIIIKDADNNTVATLPYNSSAINVGTQLKEGAYTIEIPEVKGAYDLSVDNFKWTTYDFNRDGRTLYLDIISAPPINVSIKFENEGNPVDDLEFMVDGQLYNEKQIDLSIGKHSLELVSDKYKLIKSPREFDVDRTTDIIIIKVVKIEETIDPIDKIELEQLILDCDDLIRTDSFKEIDENIKSNYYEALNSAKSVLNNPDALKNEVDTALNNLKKELNDLIGDYDEYFKQELKKLIEDAEEKSQSYLYVEASDDAKQNFDKRLNEAKNTNFDDIDHIKNSYFGLKEAIDSLDGEKPIDFTELDKLLSDYENVLNSDVYKNSTAEEKRNYLIAIDDAKNLKNSSDVTNHKIDEAINSINEALAALSGKVIDEKTEKPSVKKVTVGDDKISGTASPKSTIRVNINGIDYTSTAVNDDGEFVVAVPVISAESKIFVYSTKIGYLESDPVEVKVEANEDKRLEELIDEYDEFINSDYFKVSSEALKNKYTNAVELAKRIINENLSNDERNDLVNSIESAKKVIYMTAVTVTFETEEGNFSEDSKTKLVLTKGSTLKEAIEIQGISIIPRIIEPDNRKFIGWADKNSKNKVYKKDLSDYDYSINEDVSFIAIFKTEPIDPTPTPDEPIIPEPDYLVIPDRPRPYRPTKPTVDIVKEPTKPVETTKPVEEKKDYGIVETMPTIAATFSDLPENEAAGSIMNMVARGILKGMDNGKFEGELPITRAMVATVLKRLSKDQRINNVSNFKDVKDTDWFAEAVKWAQSQGLIKGYEDGTFKANNLVTRQELAVIIERFLKIHGITMEEIKELSYKDLDTLPAWSKDAIIAMAKVGLVEGQTEEMYNPASEFTREELAVMLEKIIIWVEKH